MSDLGKIIYELCSLPDLKITGIGAGNFKTIEAGGFSYNAEWLTGEEALLKALLHLRERIYLKNKVE